MRDEQARLGWVGPIHRDRLEQLRSICNISRSCGPNNLDGKWVMTVALGPDTLTMFDELPKGWGDDHLNDHTTVRNRIRWDLSFGLFTKSSAYLGCQSATSQLGNYICTYVFTYLCIRIPYTPSIIRIVSPRLELARLNALRTCRSKLIQLCHAWLPCAVRQQHRN